jgi:diaminopimelate decarboxylase
MKVLAPDWLDRLPLKTARTPFYLYSEEILSEVWDNFAREVLGRVPDLHLHFALKANNNPHVLSFFKARGCGLDLVSYFEAEIARKNSFAMTNCVFSGVGKSNEELERALKEDIFLINIESESEFRRLEKIAGQLGKKARVAFRVNPDVDARTHPYIATGLFEHKFGLDFESAERLYLEAARSAHLKASAISVHIGSQLLDLGVLEQALDLTQNFAAKLKGQGLALDYLDVGGGVGIRYNAIDEAPDFASYGKILERQSTKWKKLFGPQASLLSECGRSLCAQSGYLVTQVLAVKENIKKRFAVVDASMTELMRPALYQAEHPIIHLEKLRQQSGQIPFDVVGPVCESSDVLARAYQLPPLQEGEHLLLLGCGAYGYTMANHYNGRPLPEEWWLPKSGAPELSRPRRPF